MIDPSDAQDHGQDRLRDPGRQCRTRSSRWACASRRDGKLAFVALGPANRVAVIDAATFKVEKYLLVGQRVWQLAFTPDEKLLFTTNGASNDVSVIDVEKAARAALDQGRALSLGRGRRAVLRRI